MSVTTAGMRSFPGVLVFFFQAEDGIRDVAVTGVQTCALPISTAGYRRLRGRARGTSGAASFEATGKTCAAGSCKARDTNSGQAGLANSGQAGLANGGQACSASASKAGADCSGEAFGANGKAGTPASRETNSRGTGETTRQGE